jgi:hypothetical protein
LRANVTLVSFTATSIPGQPEIFVAWETATQFETLGFFVTRSDSATGTFTRVSDFISRDGDDLTGAEYGWIDEDTVLNQAYWYKLEEITTSQQSEFYGPIMGVAGAVVTTEPTATHTPTTTPTATFTPSPTATPTTQPDSVIANPTTSSGGIVSATPRPATGATVTPRPVSSGGSPGEVVVATFAPPSSNAGESQPQPPPVATVPVMADAPAAAAASSAATAGASAAQAPNPTLVPADTAPAIAAPAVVVKEATPVTSAAEPANGSALLLVAAACLFLGIAFVILRQVRQ